MFNLGYSDVFGAKKNIGVSLNLSHTKDCIRSGANLRLDFKVSENSRLYLNGFYTRFSNKQGHEGGNTSVTGHRGAATMGDSCRRGNPKSRGQNS